MPDHELYTRMLFVDAIVGVGFPHQQIGVDAVRGHLATFTGNQHNQSWAWTRSALESLTTHTLQELYGSLKLHEVTHHAG